VNVVEWREEIDSHQNYLVAHEDMLIGGPVEVPKITKEITIALTSRSLNIESGSSGDLENAWFLGRNFDEKQDIEPEQ
jgi:hypothetical protein